MKSRLLLLMLITASLTATAQNEDRPGWLANKPKASNSTYVYVVERGGGATVNEAVNNALLKVLRTTMMRIGAVVSWEEVNNSLQKGTDWGSVAIQYNIPINKVCEYVEQKTDKGYRVAVLCQVAKNGTIYPEFDDFTACSDTKSYSDGTAALKSAVLPGLGQIGKNHKGAGTLTMLGEAALVGGTITTYFLGKRSLNKMAESSADPYYYYRFSNQYNTWCSANHVFGVAAATLYVYNIFRAYFMVPRYRTDIVTFAPVMLHNDQLSAAGLGVTFNF